MSMQRGLLPACLTLLIVSGCATGSRSSDRSVDYKKRAAQLARELKRKNALIENLREKNLVLSSRKQRAEPVEVKSPKVIAADKAETSVWQIPAGAFQEPVNHQIKEDNPFEVSHIAGVPRAAKSQAVSPYATPTPVGPIPGFEATPLVRLPKTLPAKKTLPGNDDQSWANPPPAPEAVPLEKSNSGTTDKPTPVLSVAPESGEHFLYSKVMQTFRKKDVAEMDTAVRLFLKTYPESVHADNALYLAGALALSRQDWSAARKQFDRILREYPRSNKAVSALFGKGAAQKFSRDFVSARKTFTDVQKFYRGSPEAQRVALELRMIEKLEKTGRRL